MRQPRVCFPSARQRHSAHCRSTLCGCFCVRIVCRGCTLVKNFWSLTIAYFRYSRMEGVHLAKNSTEKPKRPTWFKVFLSSKPFLDGVPNEDVGQGLKAALAYFEKPEAELPAMSPLTRVVFSGLKSSIEDAFRTYQEAVENGKKGANERWGE